MIANFTENIALGCKDIDQERVQFFFVKLVWNNGQNHCPKE
jgi:hypothetical protein